MKQSKSVKLVFILLVFSLFTSNCISTPPVITPKPTVSLTPISTSTPAQFLPTYSPADVATVSAEIYPLPTAPQGYATPFPPFGNQHYTYKSIRFFDKYIVRSWYDPFTRFSAITISKVGQPQINLEGNWLHIDELSGIDVINEGYPSLIIRSESGGGICCTSTIVYNLGETPIKVMDIEAGNAKGYFIDLNNDGVYDYIAFDYWNLVLVGTCMACMEPIPVVLKYQPETGYTVASPEFQEFYDKNISRVQEKINKLVAEDPKSRSLNDLVGYVALCYIYSGREEEGWAFIDQYYSSEDSVQLKLKIQDVLQKSSLYKKSQ